MDCEPAWTEPVYLRSRFGLLLHTTSADPPGPRQSEPDAAPKTLIVARHGGRSLLARLRP